MAFRLNEIKILSYNRQAMDILRNEDFEGCYSCLKKAEALLNTGKVSNLNKIYGITLNNFGCYYKRSGNLTLALNFLLKGLEVLNKPPVDLSQLGATHLNICAILSQIGDHNSALSHALKALDLLKSKYLENPSFLTTIIVAYHSSGIEYEFLGQLSEAFAVFKKSYELSYDKLGENHHLTTSLKRNLDSVIKKGKTSAFSPRKNATSRSRASAPRSLQSSQKENEINDLGKTQDIRAARFLTGERLKPMYDKEKLINYKKKNRPLDLMSYNSIKNTVKQKDQNTSTNNLNQFKQKNSRNTKSIQVNFQIDKIKIMRTNAAVTIQKCWRRYKAKKILKQKIVSEEIKKAEIEAKNALEKLWTLKNNKKFEEILSQPVYNKNHNKSIKYPPQARAMPTKAKEKLLEKFIITIQKNIKMWIARKNLIRIKNSCIIIQKNIKQCRVTRLYQQIKEAIVYIQRFWRRYKGQSKSIY